MNNNLTLKFDFKTGSTDCAYSLMNIIMDKLKTLKEACAELKYVEVKMFNPDDAGEDKKTAQFTIISDNQSIAETSRAKRWEDAFLNAFDKVYNQITKIVGG